ncbi:hypothetical protein VNO77_20120 [Canavalia gladiata]|uniref:Uncharacterized protein n=1 Tax=Canavalia gladiata TaxID=3824 RepID=A0AAN9QL51_CANGL
MIDPCDCNHTSIIGKRENRAVRLRWVNKLSSEPRNLFEARVDEAFGCPLRKHESKVRMRLKSFTLTSRASSFERKKRKALCMLGCRFMVRQLTIGGMMSARGVDSVGDILRSFIRAKVKLYKVYHQKGQGSFGLIHSLSPRL